MNKLLYYICCPILLMWLSACSKEYTAEDIATDYASGMVAIKNTFYYKVQLAGGHVFWFVPDSDAMTDIRFYTSENDVKPLARTTCGTGFFLSDEGVVVTASQVANPEVNTNDVCRALTNQLLYLKNYYTANLDLYKRRLALVEDAFGTLADERVEVLSAIKGNLELRAELEKEYADRKGKLEGMQSDFRHKTDSLAKVLDELNHFNNTQVSVYPVQRLSLACPLPGKGGFSPYRPCTLLAANSKTGLAIVQMAGKKTPENCHVFELDTPSFLDGWTRKKQPDGPLFILGLKGNQANPAIRQPFVAETGRTASKDSGRIAYTRPVGGDNCGSPVLDAYGTLVGVNASDNGGDYGIPIEKLLQMVKITTR